MAKQYVITEEEMLSLIESLELAKHRQNKNETLTVEEMHRSFHFHVVRWVQNMGFEGYRK